MAESLQQLYTPFFSLLLFLFLYLESVGTGVNHNSQIIGFSSIFTDLLQQNVLSKIENKSHTRNLKKKKN